MTVTLTVAQVENLTGSTVTDADINLASQLMDDQTGYTPSEHNDDRAISVLNVQAAWAIVAARVHRMLHDDDTTAVTSETQGDYSYAADVGLIRATRFSNVCDGRPQELLNLNRARWSHI